MVYYLKQTLEFYLLKVFSLLTFYALLIINYDILMTVVKPCTVFYKELLHAFFSVDLQKTL